MTHTIGMISLGCAKNQVNAEQMLYLLRQAGYEILPDPEDVYKRQVIDCGAAGVHLDVVRCVGLEFFLFMRCGIVQIHVCLLYTSRCV